MTYGEMLKTARQAKELSLRDVERVTEISNGYLSLLESNSVKQPSPHHLHRLATLYDIDYAELMRLVGYEMPAIPSARGGLKAASALGVHPTDGLALSAKDLTAEEQAKVQEYAAFIRSQRREPPPKSARKRK